ncbi:unnamed protein product [Parnassius apollo]|uniref:(apollo) hypothetical protein n=1 Tax=Parnassius apollo TaxID=110799 RepID=A0A8S3XGE2_PARAO|nr:unnamed protein product [Parnassius apollo]
MESQIVHKPFPAVVVTPVITFPEHRVDAFIKKLDYPSGFNETYTREVIQQLAAFFSPDVPYKLADLDNIEKILEYNRLDIEASGIKLTESCEETITREVREVHLQRNTSSHKWYEVSGITSALMLVINQSLPTLFDINLSYKWVT